MNTALPQVSVVGAGRMGEGIALAFIHAGLPVTLIDIKDLSLIHISEPTRPY